MYSTLSYQIASVHTTDLYQQATRERAARAAGRARSAQPNRRTRSMPGHTVTVATYRVLARLGAQRTTPAR